MQNIDVRFNASSNFAKVRADLSALQAQVAALNSSFARGAYATPPAIIDPAKWRAGTSAITAASNAYRTAASSSGLLTTQNITATSEAEKYTRALQKQKLTLGQMMKTRKGVMKEVYNDQLRQQRMTAQYWGTDQMGRQVTDITMPKNVPTELDNWRRRAGFFGNAMASAGTQVINTGKNIQWAGRQLMVGFTYPMVLFGAAAGVMAFKVEAAFAKINKVYDVSAAAQMDAGVKERELGRLRVDSLDAAREAAERYGTTVEKFLTTESNLAASGLQGEKLISATSEVSRISALGDIDAEQTTEMVVALQTAFRDTIPDSRALTENLNFMNAASNVTSLSLQDVAVATPRAASGLAKLGVTAKEMTILLVSMREAGIDSTSGGNALKSLSTRIMNPAILARAQKAYERFGVANINLQKIIDNNQGNIYGFVKDLGKAQEGTAKLTDYQKQQVAAILAGANQYSRFSAIINNVGDAQNGVNNQTAAAIELQGKSAGELEKMAAESERLMVQNPAGQLKIAWAELQMMLSEMGGPFLKAAAGILKALGKIGKWFQDLPSGAQKLIAYTAVFAALAGPLIMMVGLFLNLSGWLMKAVGGFAKLVGISKLYTKEQTAAALTTQAVNNAMATQQGRTSTLAAEIRVLAASYEQAALAANRMMAATTTAAAAAGTAAAATATAAAATAAAAGAVVPRPVGVVTSGTNNGATRSFTQAGPAQTFNPANMGLGSQARPIAAAAGQTAASMQRQAEHSARVAESQRNAQRAMMANNQQAMQARGTYDRMNQSITGMGVGMGIAGAAMAVMMITAGSAEGSTGAMVGDIAKWSLIATLIVPAVGLLAKGLKFVVAQTKLAVVWMKALAASSRVAAGSAGVAGMAAGARGVVAGLASAIGVMGGIAIAAVAIGAAIYIWKKNADEAFKKAQDAFKAQASYQKQINSSAERWAVNVGKAVTAYKTFASDLVGRSSYEQSAMTKNVEYYTNESPLEEGGKNTVQGYNDLGSETEKTAAEVQMFQDLQYQTGLTAKDAAKNMEAFYIAAGESAIDAQQKAEALLDTWKQIKGFESNKNNLALQVESFNQSDFGMGEGSGVTAGQMDIIEQKAIAVAQAFNQAFVAATTPTEMQAAIDELTKAATSGYDEAFSKIADNDDYMDAFETMGINGGKALQDALSKSNGDVNAFMSQFGDALRANGMSDEDIAAEVDWVEQLVIPQLESATSIERALLGATGSAVGMGDQLRTVNDLMVQLEYKAKTLSYKDQKEEIKGLADAYFGFTAEQEAEMAGMDGATKKQYINRIRGEKQIQANALAAALQIYSAARGLQYSGKLAKDLAFFLGGVKEEAASSAREVDALAMALRALKGKNLIINIKSEQLGGIFQGGIENVQNRMVEDADYIFDETTRVLEEDMQNAQDAASNSLQDQQESASNALQDRHESASNALSDAQAAASRAQQDRHEAASRALQDRQEAAMRAFDDKWEKRKDALTAAYDKRNEAIENTIKREQKADEIRARLFENEKKRLQDLADKANTQIDFDVAVNTGDLDEAAKIQNNAQAKGMSDEMDKEQQRAELQTQNLIDRLEKKRERLEKARDKALKRLEKVEERMRRSMEKMQEAQQRALQNQQEAQQRALEKSQEAQQRMLEARQEAESRALQKAQEAKTRALQDQQAAEQRSSQRSRELSKREHDYKMELFKSLPAANKKQLEAALKASGLTLKDFGLTELNGPKGVAGQWGSYFQKYLDEGLRMGAADAAKSNMWESVTGDIAKKMLKGFGFASMSQFETFVRTGKKTADPDTQHGGGEVGKGSTGRGGIHTKQGLHRTEQMVRAQKGEYIVNRRDASKHREVLERINSGTVPFRTDGIGGFTNEMGNPGNSGFAHLGHGYGAGFRGVAKGMGPGIKAGLTAIRERNRAAAQRAAAQSRGGRGGGATGNYIPGPGGRSRPISGIISNGLHNGDGYQALDIAAPIGTPVYAVESGKITSSYDIPGYESRRMIMGVTGASVQDGMRSYGRVMTLAGNSGNSYVYSHLSKRNLSAGSKIIPGGSVIGYSGNAGNVQSSSGNGAHLHWGPRTGDPYAFLRNGGEVKYDNTTVQAHAGESILTKRLTTQFKENVSGGSGGDTYKMTLDFRGAMIKEEIDIQRAVETAIDNRDKRRGLRRTTG